jgi:hypothetical protein
MPWREVAEQGRARPGAVGDPQLAPVRAVGRNGYAEASWVKVGVTRLAVSLGLAGAVLPAGRSN